MKRSTPLRRTPLARGGRLRRRSTTKAGQDAIYAAFRARWLDGAVCDSCAARPATEVHHRRTRGLRGHLTLPANCARLCSACHRWVHDHPADAHADGWLVWPGDPEWAALAARPDRSLP